MNPRRSKVRRFAKSGAWVLAILGLLVVYLFVHLNQFGLPSFIKRPLLDQLRQRGFEVDFHRLRWRMTRGLVAEQVRFVRHGEQAGEQFNAQDVQLKLSLAELIRGRAEIESLRIAGGSIVLPLVSNAVPAELRVEDFGVRLIFVRSNFWQLENLEGRCAGIQFQGAARLTNAMAWRSRKPKPPPTSGGAWREPVRRVLERLTATQFTGPPSVEVDLSADPLQPEASTLRLHLQAPGASNELGQIAGLKLEVHLRPNASEAAEPMLANLELTAQSAALRWGVAEALRFRAESRLWLTNRPPAGWNWELSASVFSNRWAHSAPLTLRGRSVSRAELGEPSAADYRSEVEGRVEGLGSPQGGAGLVELSATIEHTLSDWSSAEARLGVTQAETIWGRGGGATLQLIVRPTSGGARRPELGLWNGLLPFQLSGEFSVTNVASPQLSVRSLRAVVGWKAPRLELRSLEASLYDAEARISGELDIQTREARGTVQENVDLHRLFPVLTENARRWLGRYEWPVAPPVAKAELAAILPAWTNRQPDWRQEVLPTLRLAGDFAARDLGFQGLTVNQVRGRFSLTNGHWYIPHVRLERPEGFVEFSYRGRMYSPWYHFELNSQIDPDVFRPLVTDERQRRVFEQFRPSTPPSLQGEVWGSWQDPERTGAQLTVAVTNAFVRGETVDRATGVVTYTNGVVVFRDVILEQGLGRATVPGAAYDVPRQLLSFTNAISTLRPESVTHVIGPKTTRSLEPYRFTEPPRVVVNGVIGTRSNSLHNARFDIVGGEFRWSRLRADSASAIVYLSGERVAISNLQTTFYGGHLAGDLHFDWEPLEGTRFDFGLSLTNVDLRRFMSDTWPRTNQLEGFVSGRLNLDHAESWNTNSWQGHGQLTMVEGFLWGAPVFSIFSPLFEAVSPGLGQTRFTSGTSHFVVTNSVIRTDNLEMRSPAVRLRYSGSVDQALRLDARMEAELLRDLPVVGPLLSVALSPFTKLFEYRVRGTLGQPIAEPLHIPRVLLVPLQPFRALKGLFHAMDEKPVSPPPATNSAPNVAPPPGPAAPP